MVRPRRPVRPVRRQRGVGVHHRQDPRAQGNLLALQPLRVALAVPVLVVGRDQRGDRVGEGHVLQDLRPYDRVGLDLLELLERQRPGLREDVLGHGQVADVVQQRRRLESRDFVLRHADDPREADRVRLHLADLHRGRAVPGLDGQRKRLDRGELHLRRALHLGLFLLDPVDEEAVAPVREDGGDDDEDDPQRIGLPLEHELDERGTGRAHEVAGRAPQETVPPDARDGLGRRKRNRRRHQPRVDHEVHERRRGEGHDQRLREAVLAGPEQLEHLPRGLHRDRQGGHAERRAIPGVPIAHPERALAPGAHRDDERRGVWPEEEQRRHVHREAQREAGAAARQRQRELDARAERRQGGERQKEQRLREVQATERESDRRNARRHGDPDVHAHPDARGRGTGGLDASTVHPGESLDPGRGRALGVLWGIDMDHVEELHCQQPPVSMRVAERAGLRARSSAPATGAGDGAGSPLGAPPTASATVNCEMTPTKASTTRGS